MYKEIPETPVEFLKNLKRELILTQTGFGAYIRQLDIFITIGNEHPECLVENTRYIDQLLGTRKAFTNYIEDVQLKIKLLDEEIEREIQAPNKAPMIYRLLMLFKHL